MPTQLTIIYIFQKLKLLHCFCISCGTENAKSNRFIFSQAETFFFPKCHLFFFFFASQWPQIQKISCRFKK